MKETIPDPIKEAIIKSRLKQEFPIIKELVPKFRPGKYENSRREHQKEVH